MDEGRLSELARTGRTRDARGRTVKMVDPKKMYLLRRHDVIERETLNGIMDDIDPEARRGLRLAVILVIPIVLITFGGIVVNGVMEGPAFWQDLKSTLKIMWPMLIACLGGGVIAPWIATRQQRMKRVRWAMLLHERCPHCAYDLHGLPTDSTDGATVCPECACAWRLDETAESVPGGGAEQATARRRQRLAVALVMVGLGLLAMLGMVFMLLR